MRHCNGIVERVTYPPPFDHIGAMDFFDERRIEIFGELRAHIGDAVSPLMLILSSFESFVE